MGLKTGVFRALALGACAVAGIVAAPSGAQSTHTARATDTFFSVSMTGPSSLELSRTAAPPRQYFTVTMTYIGPAFQPGDSPISGTMSVQLSQYEMNFGVGEGLPPALCTDFPPQNTPGVSWSCPFNVGPGNPTSYTFQIGVRPTGVAGTGPTTFSLSTGASASVTTSYFYPDTTTETTPDTTTTTTTTTTSQTTVAAAATTTVTESFTPSTPPQAENVTVVSSADTVTVGLAWPSSADQFDVTGVEIIQNGQVVARAPQSASTPRRLVVVRTRTKTSLKLAIKNPVRGKLRFKIVGRKVAKPTRVKATIRQTKRR
jgi:hypothetical protein